MPEDVYTQNYPDEQWGDFWGWARGDQDTIGGEPTVIDTRPPSEIVPDDEPGLLDEIGFGTVGILDSVLGAAGDAMDPWGILGTNTSETGIGGTLKDSAAAAAGNFGKALGQVLGVGVLLGVGYLLLKPNLSSKAT